MQISDLFSLEDLYNRRSAQQYPVYGRCIWQITRKIWKSHVKRGRNGRLLFTFKSLKTLADNTEQKFEIYLRATHNDISNINL